MNQKDYAQNIEHIWDWIEEQTALAKVFPGYPNDTVDVDKEESYVQDEPEKPDNPDELVDYERGIAGWIEQDQMETLKEAFPEEYP